MIEMAKKFNARVVDVQRRKESVSPKKFALELEARMVPSYPIRSDLS
mgnify:FL=1|jgi:hypothetical protein